MPNPDRLNERVVITGLGLVSPVGNDPETAWQTILKGGHGVRNVRDSLFAEYHSLPIHVAAPVKSFDLLNDSSFSPYRKEINNKWDTSQQFVLWSGAQALRQAGLLPAEGLKVDERQLDPERFGLYIGTGIGGANELAKAGYLLEQERERYEKAVLDGDEELMAELEEKTRIKPKTILKALPGRVAATPSMVFNAKAFWKGLLQECASGNGAIISAIEAIRLDKADVVLAGGVEGEITPTTIGLFGAAGAVSRNRNAEEASRPLDAGRDGLVMGQGAGVVVVESMSHALERGAPILAEIAGYAENADALYETEPDPVNVLRCIHKAVNATGWPVHELTGVSINLHATSTTVGDPAEMKAAREAFQPKQVAGIAATKAATGHMLGAAGAAEAVFSVLSLRDGLTPPTHNLEQPIEEAEGYEHLMNQSEPIEAEIEYVVNNSFGFGGNNAVTIFTKPK